MKSQNQPRHAQSRRNSFAILGLVVAVLVAVAAAVYTHPVRLGLDLQGGLEIVLKATPTDGKSLAGEQLEQSVEVIRSRVDGLGTSEAEIRTQGNDQIVVSLPGEQDARRAVEVVGATAQLRFYEWEKNVINKKAFRNAYQALRSAEKRVEESHKADPDAVRQMYLFDSENKLIVGPAITEERLVDQARDAIGALAEKDRPKKSDAIIAPEEGKEPSLPKDWTVLEAPAGELLVHGPPEQIEGNGVVLQTGGKFNRNIGAYALITDKPGLTGDNIKSASAEASQGAWATSMIFDREGGKKFGAVTEQIAKDGALNGTPQRFAIILDDEIKSIPQIDYRQYPRGIKGNQAQISGLDDREEAADLALVLNTGALPVRFEVISRTQVSATLGSQSLRQGLLAGITGLVIVMVYLVLFYRVLGIIADFALLAFALIFYGVIVTVPVTMTLPGIAGVILTVGVAADANIIIFERIREEYRAGRSVVQSISAGYKKGFATILDASAVTLITATLLFVVSIGSVRGFAALMAIGTVLSIFTAVFFTYALLGLMATIPRFQKAWVIGGSRKRSTVRWNFNWMKRRKRFLLGSVTTMSLSVLALIFLGLNLGVDFKSGTRFDVTVRKDVSVEQVRDVLVGINAGYANSTIQETRDVVAGGKAEGKSFTVTVEDLRGGTEGAQGTEAEREQSRQDSAKRQITDTFDREFGLIDQADQTIGPSFGKQVINLAIIAVVLSLILEVLYIWWRFEFLFSIPVLVVLLHDMLLSLGAYALAGHFIGLEFKSTTVAAILTILGYGLYDTIIVFDRIRENVQIMRKSSFQTIVNKSINEVLTRSLNTSFVVLLPTIALFFFGGATLKDFAFAMIIGIMVGVSASITIATSVLVLLKERDPAWKKRREAEEAALASGEAHVLDDSIGVPDELMNDRSGEGHEART
ncbi:MAG: protein translocase subunit SecD [Gaiellales bacterium]